VQKLNFKLEKYASEIEVFNKKDEELSRLISILQPKKEEVEAKNQDIINMLNQRMSQKAECQIKLNETRETLRETLQSVN
jgi:chromosome segregation ATPase